MASNAAMSSLRNWLEDGMLPLSPSAEAKDHAAGVAVRELAEGGGGSGGVGGMGWREGSGYGDQDEDWQFVEAGGEPNSVPPSSALAHGITDLDWQLEGEDVLFLSTLSELMLCDRHVGDSSSTVAVTNFRISVKARGGDWIHVPLGAVSESSISDGYLHITARDCRDVRLKLLPVNEAWSNAPAGASDRALLSLLTNNRFDCKRWLRVRGRAVGTPLPSVTFNETPKVPEGFETRWRTCSVNRSQKVCRSYPSSVLVPSGVTDEEVCASAAYRSIGRFPAPDYIHLNGACIARCSQPMSGVSMSRCAEDEALIRGIVSNSTASPHVDIVDARPSLNVYANTAAGGGIEPVGAGGYGKAVVTMLGIGNIHVMRDSYNKLRRHSHTVRMSILSGGTGGEAAEEWLEHISLVMGGASHVAAGLERGRCTVLHCSHGWDRTSQVSALAILLLDPLSRTVLGFCELIQRSWCYFGHKFGDRCGHGDASQHEESPIFIQFLDCVWQFVIQHPLEFEFDERLLLLLADSAYDCLHCNFVLNTNPEREALQRGGCLWGLVASDTRRWRREGYAPRAGVLKVRCGAMELKLWAGYYLRWVEWGGLGGPTERRRRRNEHAKEGRGRGGGGGGGGGGGLGSGSAVDDDLMQGFGGGLLAALGRVLSPTGQGGVVEGGGHLGGGAVREGRSRGGVTRGEQPGVREMERERDVREGRGRSDSLS